MGKEVLVELRSQLESLYTELNVIKEKTEKDYGEEQFLTSYDEYQKENPGATLNRASRRIKRKGFNICLAGGFSGGKSTTINALLQEPGLLAAEAGECTMSITSITAPERGENEHISIFYYTREEALKNVVTNARYYVAFEGQVDELAVETDEEKIIAAIKAAAAEMAAGSDGEDRKRGSELTEFLDYVEKFANRLGKEHTDEIRNGNQYLTTDREDKGMGHLMLIERVQVYRNNPLFVENGIRIVDLPGTDSPNERQKELTHQAEYPDQDFSVYSAYYHPSLSNRLVPFQK